MFSERELQRLPDIVENTERAESYIEGMSFDAFTQDRRTMDAVERWIERVIEATIQLGPEKISIVLADFPAAQVRGMGNRLRHEYGTINALTVWNTVTEDLRPLRDARAILLRTSQDG